MRDGANRPQSAAMVSVIMAVRNSPEFTRRGVRSVLQHTLEPFELIVIDNGSGEETRAFLETLTDPRVKVIRNEDNLGCARSWNQGIREASGEHVTIANNDIEVPRGWLRDLKAVHEETGAAWVSPAMREGEFDYDFGEFHRRFVERFGSHLWENQFRAVALFSSKSLYTETIGFFDESFVVGTYEDEDYFWRIRKAGLRSVITGRVLVHHYGSRTLSLEKRKTPHFIKANRRTFHRKWWRIYPERKMRNRRLKREMRQFERENGFRY